MSIPPKNLLIIVSVVDEEKERMIENEREKRQNITELEIRLPVNLGD